MSLEKEIEANVLPGALLSPNTPKIDSSSHATHVQ